MHQSKSNNLKSNSSQNKSGFVRIIGGKWRGRRLNFFAVNGLRPSLDRTRETLFNWLAGDIYNSSCLDLFAGSGALGFEAASRGAKKVVLVEQHKKVIEHLKKNCDVLQADNINVFGLNAKKFLEKNQEKFNLVFLDPPFGKDLLYNTLHNLKPHLTEDAIFYIETSLDDHKNKHYQQILENELINLKFKKTSSFCYGLYQMQ